MSEDKGKEGAGSPVEPAQTETGNTGKAQEKETKTVSYVNEDGKWNTAVFKDDLGAHSILEKYATPEDLVKAAINKDKVIGRKLDDLLASEDPEIVEGLKARNGVPKTSDEYEVVYPDGFDELPDDARDAIDNYLNDSAQWALEQGVPKRIFDAFVERDLARALADRQEQLAAEREAFEQAEAELKKEWRGKYPNNVEKAENMAVQLGLDDLVPILKANPPLLKQFHDGVSKLLDDDTIISAVQKENMATLQDELDDLDDRMINYPGPTTDVQYRRLLDKKTALLDKLKQGQG